MRVVRAAVVLGLSTPLVVLACGSDNDVVASAGAAGDAGEANAAAGSGGSGAIGNGGSSNGQAGTGTGGGLGGDAGSGAPSTGGSAGNGDGGAAGNGMAAGGQAGNAGNGGTAGEVNLPEGGAGAGGSGTIVSAACSDAVVGGNVVCFHNPVPLTLGEGSPTDLAIGAWDTGADLDILVANSTGLSYFANSGTGTFSTDTWIGDQGQRVSVGKLDSGSALDYLLINTSTISAAFGDGEGLVIDRENQTLGEGQPNNFFVSDVPGTGASQDYVIASDQNIKVVVTSGTEGEGYVDTAAELYVQGAGDAVLAKLGSAMSVVYSHGTDVYRGKLTYTTGPSALAIETPVATAVNGTPAQLDVADFNGDGFDDIAATLDTNGNIKVLFGDGVGTGAFATVANSDHFLTLNIGATVSEQTQRDIKTGDFTGDGKADIAVSVQALGAIAIFAGDGAGGFSEPHFVNTGVGSGPTRLSVGDLNKDGVADLAVIGASSTKVIVLLSDP